MHPKKQSFKGCGIHAGLEKNYFRENRGVVSEEGPKAPEGHHQLGLRTSFKPPLPITKKQREEKRRGRSPRKRLRSRLCATVTWQTYWRYKDSNSLQGSFANNSYSPCMHWTPGECAGMRGTIAGKRGPPALARMCGILQSNRSKGCGITAELRN
eukprot:1157460-Pelagomonas_calceolata.AAC.5